MNLSSWRFLVSSFRFGREVLPCSRGNQAAASRRQLVVWSIPGDVRLRGPLPFFFPCSSVSVPLSPRGHSPPPLTLSAPDMGQGPPPPPHLSPCSCTLFYIRFQSLSLHPSLLLRSFPVPVPVLLPSLPFPSLSFPSRPLIAFVVDSCPSPVPRRPRPRPVPRLPLSTEPCDEHAQKLSSSVNFSAAFPRTLTLSLLSELRQVTDCCCYQCTVSLFGHDGKR